ncbi:MAG: hypothetical protein EDM05_61355 [Leptolyngbya sp. IPPAS B-1204]|nr:hypothetical protein [Elainella sp. C42_A2020_010]RNJ66117.1 MAG: hypothetical protein EDM05_27560 [Leptolyngbya sp. IPPAS B-1204]
MKLPLAAAALCFATLLPSAVLPISAERSFGFEVAQSAAEAIGQVNPNRPVQIEVVNAGDAPITCMLTQPASAERRVPPGGKTTFGSTRTNYLPLPINFLAYPDRDNIGISSYVFVEGNVVKIVIGEQISQISGDISLNINEDGSIFLF